VARRPPMRRDSSKSIPPPSRGCWRGLTLNSVQSSTPDDLQSDTLVQHPSLRRPRRPPCPRSVAHDRYNAVFFTAAARNYRWNPFQSEFRPGRRG
jgi:hypothetical protein